jgi:hypothetical protein
MLPGALDLDLDIAALQLELGNVLFDEELDEFFQLFDSFVYGGTVRLSLPAPEGRSSKPGVDPARLISND